VIGLRPERLGSVVALGAHCDDIAIGAGGTLLTLCASRPGLRVDALVLSGGGTPREDEERAALAAFCPGADVDVTVLKMPDGRFPAHWEEAKNALEELRRRMLIALLGFALVFARISRNAENTALTTIGARPSDGSSSNSMRGAATSARPMATICCSPPDSAQPLRSRSWTRAGNSVYTSSYE